MSQVARCLLAARLAVCHEFVGSPSCYLTVAAQPQARHELLMTNATKLLEESNAWHFSGSQSNKFAQREDGMGA